MSDNPKCELCGEPMPDGETMFKYHGHSGPCPKPPLPKAATPSHGMTAEKRKELELLRDAAARHDRVAHLAAIDLNGILAHIDAQAAEIERLTRERDEYKESFEIVQDANNEFYDRAEAAEARLAALSVPVGDAMAPQDEKG